MSDTFRMQLPIHSRALLAAFLMAMMLAGTGCTRDPLDVAYAAYKREDYATTLRLVRPLADGGDLRAQGFLAAMYFEGKGVPGDLAEAMKWYRKGADVGYGHSQWNVGFMYDHGWGAAQDYVEAHKWYNLAASRPGEMRDFAVWSRDEVAAKMTPAQIAAAQKLAREWKPK